MNEQPPYLYMKVHDQEAYISVPQIVEKRWGHEQIFYNDRYCMKKLVINPGQCTSMHFHIQKHESITVTLGDLILSYKDKDAKEHRLIVPQGATVVIPPGFQHRLQAPLESRLELIEASTFDQATDSVRVHM